jgi:hypothetical protein
VLCGYADTAPFSEWSFLNYLFLMAPFLGSILIFYISRLYSPNDRKVMKITSTMQFSGPIYFLLKLLVVTLTYLIAVILTVVACFIFYWKVFDFTNYGKLSICIILVLVPHLLLLQGVGIWLSKVKQNLSFLLILLLFLSSTIGDMPSYFLDVLGNSILQIPRDQIPIGGSIAFTLPNEFVVSRIVFSLIGIVLIIAGCLCYQPTRKMKSVVASKG